MAVRFYVNQFQALEANIDGDREVMIATRFMQAENITKAAEYLRPIADELTRLYNAGDVEAAADLMEEAENKIRKAQTAEKFMEEIRF